MSILDLRRVCPAEEVILSGTWSFMNEKDGSYETILLACLSQVVI